MTTEQEGKYYTLIQDTHNQRLILDEEEDSDPDLDMVSFLPSLWFHRRGWIASMNKGVHLNKYFFQNEDKTWFPNVNSHIPLSFYLLPFRVTKIYEENG